MSMTLAELHPQVAMRVLDGEAVIVLPTSGEVLVLNEVGTRIVEWLDHPRTSSDLARRLTDEYDVNAQEAQRDVDEFLATLSEAGAVRLSAQRPGAEA